MSIAYLFPGQGSQFVGMGQDLYETSSLARDIFAQADELLGFSLSEVCFSGPEENLIDTINQQPALFVTSLAAYTMMQADGWQGPSFMAGHSLGEFTALTAVHAFSFEDGLKLVRHRAQLMKKAGQQAPGAMAALLALNVPTVEALCTETQQQTGEPVQIANDNCPGQVVVSGTKTAVNQLMSLAKDSGARKVVALPISIAAHSTLMASASAELAYAVDNTPICPPDLPVIGNVTAQPLLTADDIRAELKAQLTAPVQWTATIEYLLAQGVSTFIEMGPGDVLLSLVKRVNRKAKRIKFQLEEVK